MADETVTQGNEPEARTAEGEIKDQTQTQTSDQTSTDPAKEPEAAKSEEGKEPSFLNKDDKAKSEAKPEEKKSADGAPEKYEDFKAPEGFEIDPAAVEKAVPLFKELGLNQEGAQKLVDFYADQMKSIAEEPYKAWDEMNKKWVEEIKADSDIGGRLGEVKETIGRALDTIGDPALVKGFKEAMDLTGAGNNLAFVKTFFKLASAITEGKHVQGKNPSPHGQDSKAVPVIGARALYPNLK